MSAENRGCYKSWVLHCSVQLQEPTSLHTFGGCRSPLDSDCFGLNKHKDLTGLCLCFQPSRAGDVRSSGRKPERKTVVAGNPTEFSVLS